MSNTDELSKLKEWLTTLEIGVSPSVTVNGTHHPTAVVVVDLGQPLNQIRLTSEQTLELNQKIKDATRELVGKEETVIRVSVDNNHGIHWSNIAV